MCRHGPSHSSSAVSATGWTARLSTRRWDGKRLGTREISERGDGCEALDGPLALVVALLVDLPREEVRRPARAAAPERWHLGLEGGGRSGVGLLPGVGYGLRVAVAATPPGVFPLEIDGVAWLPAEAARDGFGAQISALQVGLWVCPLEGRWGAVGALGCAGALATALQASGLGFEVTHEPRRTNAAGAARQILVFPLPGAFSLRLGVGAALPYPRQSFQYLTPDERLREVYRVSPVVVFVDAALSAPVL